MDMKHKLPLLPLRDIVVFPSIVIPLFVGRDKSITALNETMNNNKKIILATQINSEVDVPKKKDVFIYGCESKILQLLKLPDGTVKVLVEGIQRVKIIDFKDDDKFITCTYENNKDVINQDEDLLPLAITAVRRLEKLTLINKKISTETINNIKKLKDAAKIADNIASHLNTTISEKQQIFEIVSDDIFLLIDVSFSSLLTAVIAKGIKSSSVVNKSLLYSYEHVINFSSSLKSTNLTLFVPSAKTFTVPSGNFRSCNIELSHPYIKTSVFFGSSTSEFFWVTKMIFLLSFITSFNAVIDLSLPTNKGMTILGNTTISLSGKSGDVCLTSIV